MNKLPLVTIIIAVFNAAKTLQRCLDSMENQRYPNKELIIMDGGSTDGTVDILKANNSKITYWKSQSDRGIYHAWNKAIKKSKGEWICFIGADDYWAKESSLEKLINASRENKFDLISGKIALIDNDHKILKIIGKAWKWREIKKWQSIAHPGMLHNKSLFQHFGYFSEKYQIAGDYEFLLRLGSKVRTNFIDEVIVCMSSTGLSNTRLKQAFSENKDIQAHHREIGILRALINYKWALSKSFIRKFLSKP